MSVKYQQIDVQINQAPGYSRPIFETHLCNPNGDKLCYVFPINDDKVKI